MSRKIFWTAFFLIIIVSGFFLFLWWRGNRALERQAATQAAEEQSLASDEDNDGLAGWEEDLWHTDRHRSDTDGDNVLDGEEVRLGRDPRIAGPGDELSQPADQAIILASKSIADKQAPLEQLDLGKLNKHNYALVDLKLVAQENAQTRAAYQQGIDKILLDYGKNLTSDENAAMYQVMKNGDPEALATIQASQRNIQTTLSRLLLMKVPVSASFLHLNLVNSLARLSQIIYNMSIVSTEPLLAGQSAERRTQEYLGVISSIAAINRYLTKPIIP